jgi:hypothetical protein
MREIITTLGVYLLIAIGLMAVLIGIPLAIAIAAMSGNS